MVTGEDDQKTLSFCGTEQYMSPEMLLQQGHNFRMDWWCVGLLMHEMISARHPFHGPSHYDTLRNMVTKQPTIDARLSTNAATVVRSLLIKNPKARMCCTHGVKELYTLPYFAGVNWEALYEKKIPMPYKPELTGTTDISSFEATFTREAPVDSVTENSAGKRNKAGAKKGLIGYIFGGGGPNSEVEEPEVDSFKGFSFAKEGLDGAGVGAPIAPNTNGANVTSHRTGSPIPSSNAVASASTSPARK
jgi:serine/threonine protein kinase